MSRIGNKAVAIPSGVTANVDGQTVKMKGPKGALQAVLHDDVVVKMDKGAVTVTPDGIATALLPMRDIKTPYR